MTDEQVLHAMGIDDAYRVERVLAKNTTGATELVTIDGAGPFIRKKIPAKYARRAVWASLLDCSCMRLPQVVATYELPDSFVVVYDYVPGISVKESVESAGAWEASKAVLAVGDICEAVQVLHEHGIVHRDISPGNVVLAADGAHLIDLGIARMVNDSATRDTTSLGTYGFASPEQFGFAQTDARSDVYSIGCLLGYLLCGLSSDKDGYEDALCALAAKQPQLVGVVKKACAFEPSARFQSARELADALGEGTEEPQVQREAEVRASVALGEKGSWPARALLVLVGAVCCVLAVLAIAYFVFIRPSAERAASSQDPTTSEQAGSLGAEETNGEVGGEHVAGSGSAAGSGGSAGDAMDAADMIAVDDIGYSSSDGFVQYAFTARNTDSDRAVEFPLFEVAAYDEEGAIIFTDKQYLPLVGAGQTVAGSGIGASSALPARMECTVKSDLATEVLSGVEASEYTAKNLNASFSFGLVRITGELELAKAGSYARGMGQAMVTVVLRDDAGIIIDGSSSSVTEPVAGSPTAFEIDVPCASGYASYEVYASPM